MEDLYKTLLGMEDPIASNLSLRLEKFIKGSLSGIFNQQSNFDIKNPFTVFSIQALEDQLRPIAMHIILDFVWTKIRKSLKKRLLVIDESWYLMRYEDSASFVYGIVKRARKYYLAVTTATQDVQDFLSTDYGKAVLSNSSIQMLLKQSASEIDTIVKVFYLTLGEKEFLLSASVGEGLFFAGLNHVTMKVVGAPFEHTVITSNPLELKQMQEKANLASLQSKGPPANTPASFSKTLESRPSQGVNLSSLVNQQAPLQPRAEATTPTIPPSTGQQEKDNL